MPKIFVENGESLILFVELVLQKLLEKIISGQFGMNNLSNMIKEKRKPRFGDRTRTGAFNVI
jgi:hypothetical protein